VVHAQHVHAFKGILCRYVGCHGRWAKHDPHVLLLGHAHGLSTTGDFVLQDQAVSRIVLGQYGSHVVGRHVEIGALEQDDRVFSVVLISGQLDDGLARVLC
jgi:hypothetical protein